MTFRLPAADRVRPGSFAVSDTVLPSALVSELLSGIPLRQIIVSSDVGASKRRGGMWPLLEQLAQERPSHLLHRGDDAVSDYAVPRLYGLGATLERAGRLDRYERAWDAAALSTGGLSSVFAGASRIARTSVPAGDPRERAVRDVSAGVAAPLLTAFVLWLLQRCAADGVQRVHFVSRDGQVLLDIARQLAPRLGLDLDLRYLSVSRRSLLHDPDLVRRYLLQEGVGERSALVDVGWFGRQLRRIVELSPAVPRSVYVLGRKDGSTAWRESSLVQAWMYDEIAGLGLLDDFPSSSTMVEAFCAAAQGSVEGYDVDSGGVVVPRRDSANPRVEAWGLPLVRRTVTAFVDALVLDADLVDLEADVRLPAAAACDLFWRTPRRAEALAWGPFPWEENLAPSRFTDLATAYGVEDVRRRWAGESTTAVRRLWREGSLAMSSAPVRAGSRLARAGASSVVRVTGSPAAQVLVAGLGPRFGGRRDAPNR